LDLKNVDERLPRQEKRDKDADLARHAREITQPHGQFAPTGLLSRSLWRMYCTSSVKGALPPHSSPRRRAEGTSIISSSLPGRADITTIRSDSSTASLML